MFDQDAEETFDGTHQCPVNHDRLMVLPILTGIGQFEAFRIIEINLHGGTLPGTTEDVLDLDVDLGAIKHAFARVDLIGHVAALERGLERVCGDGPIFIRAHRFLGTRGEINFEFVKAEGAEHKNVKSSTRLTSCSI